MENLNEEKQYHYIQKYFVGYSDVDKNNRCKLSRIIDMLQNIATMHSKERGYGTQKMMELKLGWLLLIWRVKILKYPVADEYVEVKTWSKSLKGLHATRCFEIYDESGELLILADSSWVLFDLERQRPLRIPDEMTDAYGEISREVFDVPAKKIQDGLDENANVYEFKIEKRDIDTNNHTNNSKYVDFMMEVVPDDKIITELEINYKKQTVYNEKLKLYYNNELGVIKDENDEICTIIKYK